MFPREYPFRKIDPLTKYRKIRLGKNDERERLSGRKVKVPQL
jgi:hypothetical protein